jgi:regulator of sigma E protease
LDSEQPSTPEQPLTPTSTPAPGEPTDLRAWMTQNSVGLTLIVGAIGFILINWGLAGLINAFIVGLGLSFIIFIHELGHFAVAKWCDVHVETFSIGFGPALPGCRWVKGETTYMLAMVPLGGYVKMVGENPENDEDDTDPRSFKNKSVPQRMAIISAGVIMNVIFGCLVFIFVYMTHGMERQPGVVGDVGSGSAAWEKRTRAGDVIYQIGDEANPTFDIVRAEVLVSRAGEKLVYKFGRWGEPPIETTIEPVRTDQDGRPVIGMVGAPKLELYSKRLKKQKLGPVEKGSPAARAEPAFEFEDQIIATSTAAKPTELVPLPDDPRPRKDGQKRKDYFEFVRRTIDLAGKEMLVQVRRQDDAGTETTVTIRVPPAFHRTLGMRMRMGPVVSVQDGSPAAKAKIQPRKQAANIEGDLIKEIEVDRPEGGKLRWVQTLSAQLPEGVKEQILDPMRLPFELNQWAESVTNPQDRKVKLTVLREKKHTAEDHLVLEWDSSARYEQPTAAFQMAPTALPGLGLAYNVETTVASVADNSPATRAKKEDGTLHPLQPGDVVTGYWWFKAGEEGESPAPGKFVELRYKVTVFFITTKNELLREVWTCIFNLLQSQEVPKIKLQVERGGETFEVVLEAEEDKQWPRAERGFTMLGGTVSAFRPDTQVEKAETLLQAIGMGFDRTKNFVIVIYKNLESLLTNRISFSMHATGPIGIASMALNVADDDLYQFLLFLAMISINLAVINFLPIPVLDGGHMVFLIYEWIRGKPAAEWVRLATTYAGLALIVSLMLYVIFLDISRLWGG